MEDRPRYPKEIREPLQCWRCGENHMCKNCPFENGYVRKAHNIEEDQCKKDGVEAVQEIFQEKVPL